MIGVIINLILVNNNLNQINGKKIGNLSKCLSNNFNFSTTASNQYEKINKNNGSSSSNNNNNSSGSNKNDNLNKESNNNSSDSNNNNRIGEVNKSISNQNHSSKQNNSSSNKSNVISEIFQMKNYDEKNKIESQQNATQLENFKINLLKYNLSWKDPGTYGNDNASLISNSVLNDAQNNKLLKKLISAKIEEIFSSNDMNHKIALFNMISNVHGFENDYAKKNPGQSSANFKNSEILNLNKNIEILNNMNTNNQNTKIKENNNEIGIDQIMNESLQNEILKSIIKNFCVFLNNNGYEIIKEENILNMKTNRNEVKLYISNLERFL